MGDVGGPEVAATRALRQELLKLLGGRGADIEAGAWKLAYHFAEAVRRREAREQFCRAGILNLLAAIERGDVDSPLWRELDEQPDQLPLALREKELIVRLSIRVLPVRPGIPGFMLAALAERLVRLAVAELGEGLDDAVTVDQLIAWAEAP